MTSGAEAEREGMTPKSVKDALGGWGNVVMQGYDVYDVYVWCCVCDVDVNMCIHNT